MRNLATALATGVCIVAMATPAQAQEQQYDVPAGSLKAALDTYISQSGRQIVYLADEVRSARSSGFRGRATPDTALAAILAGSGFTSRTEGDLVAIVPTGAQGAVASATAGSPVIIVTARKREEQVLDVPIALTAFGTNDLADRGALDLKDFIETAPGVALTTDGDFQQLAIRGVATSLGGNANGFYLDNVPFTGVTVPWNPNVEAFDLNRVEVLRGPQGTLFGEGSMGGTIRILTNSPELDRFALNADARVSTTRGGDESYAVRGMVNVPIIEDVLAVRLVGMQEVAGGWVDTLDGQENINKNNITTFRGRVLFKPTERLSIEGSAWINDRVTDATSSVPDSGSVPTDSEDFKVGYDQYTASVAYEFDGADVRYAFGNNNLVNELVIDIPGLGSLSGTIDIEVQTHELIAASTGSGSLGWTFGAYYRKADREDTFILPSIGIDSSDRSISKARAIFGELEYRITPALKLAAGLRYFDEDLDTTSTGVGFTGPIDASLSGKYDSFNPRVIVTYEPSEENLIYVSAAKGFRGGQLQPSVSVQIAETLGLALPEQLDADSIWTYELGTKNVFLDGGLTVEAALYKSDWSKPAVRFELIPNAINGLANADGLDILGFEMAVIARPSRSLTIDAGISIIDSEFTTDIPGSPIVKGDTPENVSDITWNAAMTYRKPVSSKLDFFGRVGGQFASERSNTAQSGALPGDDTFIVDSRIGIEGDRFGIYLFGDNLTDENGALSFRGVLGASRPRPRTFGIQVRATY